MMERASEHAMIRRARKGEAAAMEALIRAHQEALYAFMLRELYEANRTQSVEKIDVVLRIASELRDAFAQVVAGGAAPTARSA